MHSERDSRAAEIQIGPARPEVTCAVNRTVSRLDTDVLRQIKSKRSRDIDIAAVRTKGHATDVAVKAPLGILSRRVSRKESNERKWYVPVHFGRANRGTAGAGSQTEVSNAGQQSALDTRSIYDVVHISGRDIVQRRLRGYGLIRWVGYAAKAKTPRGGLLPIESVWYELGKLIGGERDQVIVAWVGRRPEGREVKVVQWQQTSS